jgi:UDP-N-acetyl-D-galactosamine dehydrogenase
MNDSVEQRTVAIVGLGYVGLPVAVAFGKVFETIGFDVGADRVRELREGFDRTNEVRVEALESSGVLFTDEPEDLRRAEFYVVAVPTPIDEANQPDLSLVKKASRIVGRTLEKGDVVVYESTVYPGATEEECVPVLEEASGLKNGVDFKVGFSPERINPGDRKHGFADILKVVSGGDEEALGIISAIYGAVVTAGVYEAPSIKVAEAAKVIENVQRDLNIALMNELALIFDRMDIDTNEVLAAAGTKWNFLNFRPGLVGGHCIGVDPHYLTHKAERLGYIPQVILAGRRINESMGKFVAQRTIKEMIRAGHNVLDGTVTVLGLTFKEDVPDLRNSKVVDIIRELEDYGVNVQVHDPVAEPEAAKREYGVVLRCWDELRPADAIVVAVAHEFYRNLPVGRLAQITGRNPVLADVKGVFDPEEARAAGMRPWRL